MPKPLIIYINATSESSGEYSLGGARATDNWLGSQYPHTGQYYAAIHTIVTYNEDYREYIGVKLTQPMCVGYEYEVKMYLSSCDYTAMCTNIGVLFS